jgi:type IV pilus assembly protein PilC
MRSVKATLRFTELLVVLLKGKTSLPDSLRILAAEGIESRVRNSVISLLHSMKKGRGFSESLRTLKEGKVFYEPLYLTLIAAAEATGNVETVLERIHADLQRKERSKESVINMLIYPALIVLLALAGTAAIILKGIPFFVSGGLLSDSVILEAKSGAGIAGSVLLAGGGALIAVYFRIFNFDSPEFRIFYLLAFLLKGSVTLSEALSHCITNMGETKFARALVAIKKDIASGIPLSAAFAKTRRFSPYVLGWLSLAGMHGNLGEISGSISDYYAVKDGRLRETAGRLIEPAVIVLTGFYILIIMITVILPILTYTGGTL